MLSITETLHGWCREARPFALATVIEVSGSAPVSPGIALTVDIDGNAVGGISGGYVEGAVHDLCQSAWVVGRRVHRHPRNRPHPRQRPGRVP